MGSQLAAQVMHIDTAPKDEHYQVGLAERAINEIDRMVAVSLLDTNIPKCYWDIVGEHCTLLNALTHSNPTDHGITVYEARTGLIPDLDTLPPLGCFGVRYLRKLNRKDFKLSPNLNLKNQAGSFLKVANPRTRSSKLVVEACCADSEDSDLMEFDNEVLEALAHLDHDPTPPTTIKISPIPPSFKSSPSIVHACGGSNDPSDEDMASYDGDSDKDEDDGRSPVYTTRSSANVVKQSILTDDNDHSNLSHLAPRSSKSKSLASLTEQGLRANKTLPPGKHIKIHFPGYGGSYGKVIVYDVVEDLYKLEFAVDGEMHFMTFEDVPTVLPKSWFGKQARAHQARVIHYLACSAHAACFLHFILILIQVAPLLSEKFTEPRDYKMCCKAPDYSEWLRAMIKEIKDLEKMRCWKFVDLSSVYHGTKLIYCLWVFKIK